MSALNITASWTMAPSKKEKGPDLSAINAAANVIVDMFLDPDKSIANSTTLPQYEVMIWIGSFDGKRPIGYDSSIPNPPQQTIGLTNLYVLCPVIRYAKLTHLIVLSTWVRIPMANMSIPGSRRTISTTSMRISHRFFIIFGYTSTSTTLTTWAWYNLAQRLSIPYLTSHSRPKISI